MRLITDRLAISPLTAEDTSEFVAYRVDPEVARYQSWDVDYSLASALELAASQEGRSLPAPGDWLQLGVYDGVRLVGDVAVHLLDDQPDTYEVGMTFARTEQGKGFATEALDAVIRSLFVDHDAHRVVAFCDARNGSVHRLLERVGLRQESRQVEADWFKGKWTTLDGFAVLATEWDR